MDNFKLINDDCLKAIDKIEPNSIDSIVTDPPYGLTSITKRFGRAESKPAQYGKDGSFQRLSKGFMGKEWDGSGIEYNIEMWQKCLKILKPGGHLLAFGGSRTFHRIACAIEDAGFEIRDTIMWLYGSGFPKSMNIGLAIDKKNGVESEVIATGKSGAKETHQNSLNLVNNPFGGEYEIKEAQNEWSGWGTCLKPSFEPIIVARKPFKGSLVDNVLEYGVGGLNIDECRVETEERIETGRNGRNNKSTFQASETNNIEREYQNKGRFPANTILTYDQITFDEVCGGLPYTKGGNRHNTAIRQSKKIGYGFDINARNEFNDSGSACRYFYCAKASKKDRDEGLDTFKQEKVNDGRETPIDNPFRRGETPRRNTHPTVKPTELMQYLIRLVTPKGGTVLDPFMGSGSTGKACAYENIERNANYKFIGIEKEKEYCDIAEARIRYVMRQ